MKPCKAQTKAGTPCQRNASPGSDYCFPHRHVESNTVLASIIGGAMIGSLFSTGGALVGGVLGGLIGVASGDTK